MCVATHSQGLAIFHVGKELPHVRVIPVAAAVIVVRDGCDQYVGPQVVRRVARDRPCFPASGRDSVHTGSAQASSRGRSSEDSSLRVNCVPVHVSSAQILVLACTAGAGGMAFQPVLGSLRYGSSARTVTVRHPVWCSFRLCT